MDHKIGDYEYSFLTGYFRNDSLYKVVIKGSGISYEDYAREMENAYKSLFYALQNKYGKPKSELGLPSWTSVEKGYYTTCATWIIGSKTIELKIYEQGTRYYLDLFSYNTDIDLEVFLEENRKKLESQEKGIKEL